MSDVLHEPLLGYFDRATGERVEQKLLNPRELVAYGQAVGELGLLMEVVDGRDDDSLQKAAVSHGTYAKNVNQYRDTLFDLASESGVPRDIGVSYLSPTDQATRASNWLDGGGALVEIRAERMGDLRSLGQAAQAQIATGQAPVD